MNSLVLLDVFSYSCMNCLRSLKHIKKIAAAYKAYGLETVLVHPPEWEFEKNEDNIAYAMRKNHINFPWVLDKDRKIIRKFKVSFWPAQILMADGKAVYRHIGEGRYKNLEKSIIQHLGIKTKGIFNKEPKYSKFPCIYMGSKIDKKGRLRFSAADADGKWAQQDEFLLSIGKGSLTIAPKGNIVNFVAESMSKKPIRVTVEVNDKIINKSYVNKPCLYNIAVLKKKKQDITLKTGKGLAVYSIS